MKNLKKNLERVFKDLKTLTQRTEKIGKELDRLAKKESSTKPMRKTAAKAKAAKKKVLRKAAKGRATEATATAFVYNLIEKRKRGVNTTLIKERTGFNDKKIWNVINRLKSQGKIKSAKRGVYVKI